MHNFWQLATTPILWVCWLLDKNISNFVSPSWKLNNPYCHSLLLMPCQQMVPNKLLQKSVRSSQLRGQSCNLESVSMNYFLNKSWNIIRYLDKKEYVSFYIRKNYKLANTYGPYHKKMQKYIENFTMFWRYRITFSILFNIYW